MVWKDDEKTATLIDISVLQDYTLVTKTAEKLTQYREIKIEIQKCWGFKKVGTVPMIVGALCTVCTNLATHLKIISKEIKVSMV